MALNFARAEAISAIARAAQKGDSSKTFTHEQYAEFARQYDSKSSTSNSGFSVATGGFNPSVGIPITDFTAPLRSDGGYSTSVSDVKSHPVQVPAYVAASVTVKPTGVVSSGVMSATTARDKRQKEMNANFWSNDPTIASMEQKSWTIYVETGRWDSAEQVQLHKDAEEARKALNPMYKGSPWGPMTKAQENKIILPTDQFQVANSLDTKGLVAIGGMGLLFVVLMSMFRS